MFAEHLELLVRLWTEEDVHWSGEHRTPLAGITTHPRPFQTPRPPIWVGGGASTDSVDLAARLGLWLMLPTVFGTPESFRPMVERYEEQWELHGHDPADRRIGCCTHTFVASTGRGPPHSGNPATAPTSSGSTSSSSASTGGRATGLGGFDFEERCATTAMCGSPDELVDRMGELRELLHLDTQLLMFDMGGLPDDELRAVIELAGADVIPKL